ICYILSLLVYSSSLSQSIERIPIVMLRVKKAIGEACKAANNSDHDAEMKQTPTTSMTTSSLFLCRLLFSSLRDAPHL
ncbi:unnamed protein product, partial [Brassica oleracea var. botrytis]